MWMDQALAMEEKEVVKTVQKADILDYLSFALYKVSSVLQNFFLMSKSIYVVRVTFKEQFTI